MKVKVKEVLRFSSRPLWMCVGGCLRVEMVACVLDRVGWVESKIIGKRVGSHRRRRK